MRTLCAWCRAVLDPGDPEDERMLHDGTPFESHGICAACADEQFGFLDEPEDEPDAPKAEGLG